jgi:Ca2+-binding EF-hand superfamily protein
MLRNKHKQHNFIFVLQKLDLNNDGVITIDEFINYCSMVRKLYVVAHNYITHIYTLGLCTYVYEENSGQAGNV